MKIYLLEGYSFHVPGHLQQAHASMHSLNEAAAKLVNILREEVDLDNDATPDDWQAKCLEARQARAEEQGLDLDDLENGDVWFTEMDLAGFSDDDGERWRALMASQRMHVMGWAGFTTESRNGADDRKLANLIAKVSDEVKAGKDWLHFGMEFWDIHPAHGNPEFPDTFERQLLTLYVDTLRERARAAG